MPRHKNLQVDLLKQYCEQNGAPIAARGLYRGPVTFRPMGVVFATSNFPPAITEVDDTGFLRRLRVKETAVTFTTNPTPGKETEFQSDPTLKSRVREGVFNSQILFWVVHLAKSLSPDINPSTMLQPIPEEMADMETLVAQSNPTYGCSLEDFIVGGCTLCERSRASPIVDFKAAAAHQMCTQAVAIGPMMTKVGMKSSGVPNAASKRVAVLPVDFPHPAKKGMSAAEIVAKDGLRLNSIEVVMPDGLRRDVKSGGR